MEHFTLAKLRIITVMCVCVCVYVCVCVCVCVWVTQSCPTLCDPMDCSSPGSSVHGDSLGKNTGVSCHALLQRIFPGQRSKPGSLHCRLILYRLSHRGSPRPCQMDLWEICPAWHSPAPCTGHVPAPPSSVFWQLRYIWAAARSPALSSSLRRLRVHDSCHLTSNVCPSEGDWICPSRWPGQGLP